MNTKADTSRANGARSNGPATEEGKAKSSLNAIKHGLTSNKVVVLQNENPEDYARLAADFADTFQPANLAEGSLVQEMVNSQWKRLRAEAIETGLMDLALCAIEPELGKTFDGEVDESIKIALAYRKNFENNARALANIERQIVRLSRLFQRSHDKLKELQEDRKREERERAEKDEQTAKTEARTQQPNIVEMPAKPAQDTIFPNEPGKEPDAA